MGQTWNRLFSNIRAPEEDEQRQTSREQQTARKRNKVQASKKDKNQQTALTKIPWKKVKAWSKEFRNELKNDVALRCPETHGKLDVPHFNIALTGQIGAGKSSYFNSINSVFQEEVVGARADVGENATSLTQEYRVYKMTPKGETEPLRWRICDTMGLEPRKEHDWKNILKAVGGHVPDKFKFSNEDIVINEGTPGYKADPELKDKAHCVALVIDARGFAHMDIEMKTKLKTLRNMLGAPRTYVLLTHIDDACDEVNKDVTKVYHSTAIEDVTNKVSKMLDGLPKNHIFPVKNYSKELDLVDAMDILLLYALRQMLRNAQNYLQEELENMQGHDIPTSVTLRGNPVASPNA